MSATEMADEMERKREHDMRALKRQSIQELKQKAWASSENAKIMQAHFLCIAHNLMLLMEHELEKCFGVTNQAETQRKAKRLKEMMSSADKCGRKVSIVYQIVQRFTRRSLKFIRCLRAYFYIPAPLSQMASYLRTLYAIL